MALVGLVLLILAIVTADRPECRPPAFLERHPGWSISFRAALAILALISGYPLHWGKSIVLGVPFMAAVFQRMGNHYRDFPLPGPLPLLAVSANLVFFQLMPSLVFAARRVWVRRVNE